MAKKKLDFGGNINPQYINPIQFNNSIGKLQTTLPNNGMSGNLTSGGKLNNNSAVDLTAKKLKPEGLNAAGSIAGAIGDQLEGSPVQNAVSQMGPWGAIIGTASKMGTSIGDSIGGNTGGAIKGAFDPSGILMDKNLSMGKRIIGAGVPILGGIWASKAKKKAEAKAKAEQANKNMALDAQQRSSQMVDNTPDVAVMGYGGGIKGTTNVGNTKLLEYGGKTHEDSPTGGTPVDANGQLTSMNNADALVEKDEVAWNKGKNNTYVFSNRLGFAKEAKSIMKKYEKRLGKNLDGQDNISKNTMNMQLTNLENRQEAVKSQLQQPVTNQMVDGGDITTTTNNVVTPKPAFKYPETIEKFGSFKKDLEADPVAKDRARLYHYKQVLDPLLQAKDVKGYNEFTTNVPKAIKERVKLADTAYSGGKYKAYVSPEEIQKTLGENYNDYIGLIDKFQKPALGIAGTNEKDKPITDLNYGLRNSLSISPYGIVNVNKDQTTNELKSQFNADVMYNPKTKGYNYNYKEPKEFMCGGKIKKMGGGGGIPYKDVEPFNMRTPSENLDYLGKGATNFLVGKKYKSNAPKGIGSYTGVMDSPIIDKVSKSKVAKDKSYLGDIVPIAGSTALSMAGTAYALSKLKKPKAVNLGRVNPQTISLESARESARQGASDTMGNIRTAAKGIGSPNYMNEIISGTLGTQRELGKNLTQSYLAEQTANAAAKESADKTNLLATAQETGMNLQQMDKYNDTKAGLTSNLFALPGMGVSEYLSQKNISDMTQLGSKYKFKTDPKNRFNRIMVAKGDKE